MTREVCELWDISNLYVLSRGKEWKREYFVSVFCFFPYLELSRDVPSSPVVKTELPVQWVQI